MHVSVFPCLSHLSWPRRATGPSKSPMVSWGCDSSASPNLMKLTHWCTKTQFHLFDIYKFPQKNTQNTHTLKHFTIFPFHTFQIFPKKIHSLTHPFSRLPGDSPGTGRCRQRRHRPRLGTRQSALRSEHLACSVQCKKSLHFCWDYLKNHYFFEKNLKLKKKVIKNELWWL